MRVINRSTDLTAEQVGQLLARSRELQFGSPADVTGVVGLLFLTTSLRTRAGFTAAAARLGLPVVDATERRTSPAMSASESVEDTFRTMSGMVDLLIARLPVALSSAFLQTCAVGSVVNAGDAGPAAEHPTQSLIDLRAIQDEAGPIGEQHVVVSGDLTQRTVRSLLSRFASDPPASLRLIGPPGRAEHGVDLGHQLSTRTTEGSWGEFDGATVLYLPGLPASRDGAELSPEVRARFGLTGSTIGRLPPSAVVLSPMPVIDEVAPEFRGDPRLRLFAPSDRGVWVRAAILEMMLGPGPSGGG